MVDTKELREAVERMTPGPWRDDGLGIDTESYAVVLGLEIVGGGCVEMMSTTLVLSDTDRAGIIALRNAASALLDEVERLREALESAATSLESIGSFAGRRHAKPARAALKGET